MKKRIISMLLMALMLVGILAMPVSAASKNGLQDQKVNGQWVYMTNGKVDTSYTGLAKNKNGWYYIKNGVVDFSYTGFANNQNGWWYVTKGKVNFNYTGFAESPANRHWYYVKKGKVDLKTTDVIKGKVNGTTAWWYVKNSKVTFINTVAKNKNGWWKITDGKVQFDYTGIAQNKNGWWFIRNGKVSFKDNGVWRDDTAVSESIEYFTPKNPLDVHKGSGVAGAGTSINHCAIYVVKNSKIQTDFDGVIYIYAKTGTMNSGRKAVNPPENYGGQWGLYIKDGRWAYMEDGTWKFNGGSATWGGSASVYNELNKDRSNGKWASKFKKQWPNGQNLILTINGYADSIMEQIPPADTVWQSQYKK